MTEEKFSPLGDKPEKEVPGVPENDEEPGEQEPELPKTSLTPRELKMMEMAERAVRKVATLQHSHDRMLAMLPHLEPLPEGEAARLAILSGHLGQELTRMLGGFNALRALLRKELVTALDKNRKELVEAVKEARKILK